MQKVWEVTSSNWWCVGNAAIFQLEEGDEGTRKKCQAKDVALTILCFAVHIFPHSKYYLKKL